MDPLSLVAGIIAVVGAGGQAANAIRKIASLRGASDVVLALNNEISDLHVILVAIQDVYERQESRDVSALDPRTVDPSVTTGTTNALK
ncbi:hypothetical protein MMC25_006019 [Agyrium rufum]|nr:hypothetical protein [Agyrium rufum]